MGLLSTIRRNSNQLLRQLAGEFVVIQVFWINANNHSWILLERAINDELVQFLNESVENIGYGKMYTRHIVQYIRICILQESGCRYCDNGAMGKIKMNRRGKEETGVFVVLSVCISFTRLLFRDMDSPLKHRSLCGPNVNQTSRAE